MATSVFVLCSTNTEFGWRKMECSHGAHFESVHPTLESAKACAAQHFIDNTYDVRDGFTNDNDEAEAEDPEMDGEWEHVTPTTWQCGVSCEVDGEVETVRDFYRILERFI